MDLPRIIHADSRHVYSDHNDDPHAAGSRRVSAIHELTQVVRDLGIRTGAVCSGLHGAANGMERPALAGILPTIKGHTYILDLGANVDCTPEHLLQFGVMGTSLVSSVENKATPSVGLLNIGEEDIKGNETVKKAADLLHDSGLNFYGNIEGNDIYKGTTDIVVCDGFVGNITLKTSEGLAQMLATYLREEFKRNFLTKFAGIIAMPVINAFKGRVDHRQYNGASLLGLRGIVIKSHGSADKLAYIAAIKRAVDEVRGGTLRRISDRVAELSHNTKSTENTK